jgi:hypothetical protein
VSVLGVNVRDHQIVHGRVAEAYRRETNEPAAVAS